MSANAKKTRSERVGSPFEGLNTIFTTCTVEELLGNALNLESLRILEGHDDCEGWPLKNEDPTRSVCSSPLSSPPSTRPSSPTSSMPSRTPSMPSRTPSSVSPLSSSRVISSSLSNSTTVPSLLRPDVDGAAVEGDKKQDRKRQRQREGHTKRRKRHRRDRDNNARDYTIRPSMKKHRDGQESLSVTCDAADLPVADGGFIGLNAAVKKQHTLLENLRKDGLRVVDWNGHDPKLIVDANKRVVAVLAGRPINDTSWDRVVEGARRAMADARAGLRFSGKADRRGPFKTIAYGVSYGGGQRVPGNLDHSKHNDKVLQRLMSNPDMQRVVGFTNSAFAFYFPELHREYVDVLGELFDHHPNLRWNSRNSIFPAASFNFEPDAISYEHTDFGNKANGVCPIFCGGDFDSTKGGHLILRPLGLVIQFPPGSLVFIPSAIVSHGNTPIAPTETRFSFTQYAAGGLFRWVQYGFQTWDTLEKKDPGKAAEEQAKRADAWKHNLAVFPVIQ